MPEKKGKLIFYLFSFGRKKCRKQNEEKSLTGEEKEGWSDEEKK